MRKIPKLNSEDITTPWEELHGQFIIGKSNLETPPFWKITKIGHFVVVCDPRLTVSIIMGKLEPIAVFLGWPIHPELGFLNNLENFTDSSKGLEKSEVFEAFLNLLTGRFVAIHVGSKNGRLYLDAAGSLSVVYCPSQKIIASTPLLIPHTMDTGFDLELINVFGIPYRDSWYPFGLTNRLGVHRLLPNHYLNLTTWVSIRHWPMEAIYETTNIDAVVKEIANLLKRCISYSIRSEGGLLALTAGRDSRMLLACSKDELKNIQVFTAENDWSGYSGAMDIDTAEHITNRLNINHIILPFQPPTIRDYEIWVHRTGNCLGEIFGLRNIRTMTLLDQMPGVYLCGTAAEVGRCFYWKEGDLESSSIDIKELLKRMGLPIIDKVIMEGEKWLSRVPKDSLFQLLDFAYLEQRLGCWGGVGSYADAPLKRVHPFSQRRIFELMMALPADFRFRQALSEKIIELEWPELIEFPFNEPIGLKMKLWLNYMMIKLKGRFLLSFIVSRIPFFWRFNPGR